MWHRKQSKFQKYIPWWHHFKNPKHLNPLIPITTLALMVMITVVASTLYSLVKAGFPLPPPQRNLSVIDSDKDGLTDANEKERGTDPRNFDTDNDGYSDGEEVASGYSPLKHASGEGAGALE